MLQKIWNKSTRTRPRNQLIVDVDLMVDRIAFVESVGCLIVLSIPSAFISKGRPLRGWRTSALETGTQDEGEEGL